MEMDKNQQDDSLTSFNCTKTSNKKKILQLNELKSMHNQCEKKERKKERKKKEPLKILPFEEVTSLGETKYSQLQDPTN